MRIYILFIMGIALGSSAAVLTIAPKPGVLQGNRFLFVVDTSSPMQRLEQGGRQVVFDVVYSGLEGRMQAGDTFGVWTFGQEVKAGVFPMQTWTPDKNTDLATDVGKFLKEQSSGRKSRVEEAIAKTESLGKAVKDVDVIIVTSAGARFKGDETWAVLQQTWNSRLEEARKNRKAIIIALAIRSGRVAQATLTLQGEQLQLAAPPERKPLQQASAKKVPAPEPPKVAREPIIMQGSPRPRPIDQIPTKFAPPPIQAPAHAPEPVQPAPAPEPVAPVLPTKSVVIAPTQPTVEVAPQPLPQAQPAESVKREIQPSASVKPEPRPELTVAAREPGKTAPIPVADSGVSSRTLVIIGGALMLIAGILAATILLNARSRKRVSYISRSMGD